MRGGGRYDPLCDVRDATGDVVWGAALNAWVSVEVVTGGSAGAELRVRLVTTFSARGVRGRLRHASSPFQIGDQSGIVRGVESCQGASTDQGCAFTLKAAHLLHRRELRASRTFSNVPICAEVWEVRAGRVERWNSLVRDRQKNQD